LSPEYLPNIAPGKEGADRDHEYQDCDGDQRRREKRRCALEKTVRRPMSPADFVSRQKL